MVLVIALVDDDGIGEFARASDRLHALVADGVGFYDAPAVLTYCTLDVTFAWFDDVASSL